MPFTPAPSASHPRSKDRLVGPESPEELIANTCPGFRAFIRLEGSQAILGSVFPFVKPEKLGLKRFEANWLVHVGVE